ncbi:uncharacterized protein LTR77_005160 [Saxophila tyrrhenica]|uniref:BTB domain-containing protein n=1 Tax=Saxophila tyrrhenica TaxID=1690608 RepID=A0AAV9PEK0_9PEZI|nr:hypothetical protein LTR77_005160 [Saxophila tyrrhenica]
MRDQAFQRGHYYGEEGEMGDRPHSELLGALRSLYHSRDYADLVVFSRDGTRHPVHRAIVCPRSQYLADAVRNGKWREGNDGHITLPNDEPEVVRLLIEYLYLLDYSADTFPTPEDASSHADSSSGSDTMSIRTEAAQYGTVYGTSAISAFGGPQSPFTQMFRDRTESSLTVHALPTTDFHGTFGRTANRGRKGSRTDPSPLATMAPCLALHARMYTAGFKYGIEGLKGLALDKFKIQCTRHWDSPELAEAIHIIYDTTPSSDKDLREAVADVLDLHSRLLDKPEIEIAIMEINGLAYELLKRAKRAEPEYMG